jgi:hypothetical protein
VKRDAGYAERVLRTFGMWDCNPVLTPLDPNVRLTKRDTPEVVDPLLHRRMRSIVMSLILVNMTRPDLAFTYSQLSKFVQPPGRYIYRLQSELLRISEGPTTKALHIAILEKNVVTS